MAPNARNTTPLAFFTALIVVGALLSPRVLTVASAGTNETAPTISELRDRQKFHEEQRQKSLRRLEDEITSGSMDPDTASDTRFRIEQTYKRDMDQINNARELLVQGLEAKDQAERNRSARSSAISSKTPSNALPRFQPQSVITYPQAGSSNQDTAPSAEKPYREGRQTNGGFGTRELEF